jgi:hypothetical protein
MAMAEQMRPNARSRRKRFHNATAPDDLLALEVSPLGLAIFSAAKVLKILNGKLTSGVLNPAFRV